MDKNKIDTYLLEEMSDAEREKFEDSFVEDETLFYEIVERENELVDRYASGGMSEAERGRFERSIAANPTRRQKVANSRLLRDFIVEQRGDTRTITIAERSRFLSRLTDLFRMPVLQLASAGLIVAFALWSTYLLVENRRLRSLEGELASARGRQAELQSQIENGQDAVGDLADELASERDRVKKLEETIATLKQADGKPSPSAAEPIIATLVLPASVTTRDGRTFVPSLAIPPTATRLSIKVEVPAEANDRVSIRLNGVNVASGLRVRTRGDERSVSFTVPSTSVKDGPNSVEVFDQAGSSVAERKFTAVRQ